MNFYNTDASILRIAVVKSIFERADLSVPEDIGMRGVDGKSYSWLGIGSALLAVPFYIAGQIIGAAPENTISTIDQLFGAATAVLLFLFSILLGYSRRASLYTAIFYGLGTMAWPLAKHGFDHTLETFFILLAIYYLYSYAIRQKMSYLLLSAFFFVITFTTRINSILIIPSLLIMMVVYYSKRHDFKTATRLLGNDIVLCFCQSLISKAQSRFLFYHAPRKYSMCPVKTRNARI